MMAGYSWFWQVERPNEFFPRVDGSLMRPWKKVAFMNHSRKLAYWEYCSRNQILGD
jgi:hypothetical protein